MKQKQTIRSLNLKRLLFIAAVVLFLGLVIMPQHSMAQVACPGTSTADSDGDGFTDAQECAGITLSQGNLFGGATRVPTCTGGVARDQCVDPNSKDAFVIVTRATPSLIPSDPFRYIAASTSSGGLGIAVHEITTTRTDRKITNQNADGTIGGSLWPQLAARLRESLDISDVILGSANQGIALDLATVFTQRIVNFIVNSVCLANVICVDSTAPTVNDRAAVIEKYIRHTIAHELGGHVLTLAPVYNSRYGGNHYQSGTKVVMEQSVTYTSKSGKVTWYISTAYTDPDRAGIKLQ